MDKYEDKMWWGVDLDGTLAEYSNWQGASKIGDPVPKMVKRVRRWLSEGRQVKIFTARVGAGTRNLLQVRKVIKDWCREHVGQELEITCAKDRFCVQIWDDQAVGVVKNTGERTDGKE